MPDRKARHALVLALVAVGVFGCPGRKDILGTETKIYSQHDEELVVRDFFQDRLDGFYVDVGAYMPREYSTTAYLDMELGWKGIAIDAQANLAYMYLHGKGVRQDYFQAYVWYNLSAAGGDVEAAQNRDSVAEKMTPADISEAQQVVREWTPKTEK